MRKKKLLQIDKTCPSALILSFIRANFSATSEGDPGAHPCSRDSLDLPAPDTQITNTDGMAVCQTFETRKVARGGFGITCFSNKHVRLTRPASYNRYKQCFWKEHNMLLPHYTDLGASEGFPVKTSIKAETKLTFVMWTGLDGQDWTDYRQACSMVPGQLTDSCRNSLLFQIQTVRYKKNIYLTNKFMYNHNYFTILPHIFSQSFYVPFLNIIYVWGL